MNERRLFCVCSSGHIYASRRCPYDGSESEFSDLIEKSVEELRRQGIQISQTTLLDAGVPPEALAWTIVLEFGSDEVIFDALAPASVSIGGKLKLQIGLDDEG